VRFLAEPNNLGATAAAGAGAGVGAGLAMVSTLRVATFATGLFDAVPACSDLAPPAVSSHWHKLPYPPLAVYITMLYGLQTKVKTSLNCIFALYTEMQCVFQCVVCVDP